MGRVFKHTRAANAADDWVARLQAAIVLQAVQDYRMALRYASGRRASGHYDNQTLHALQLSKWFRSAYGDTLCCGLGDKLARKVEKEEGYATGIE